jgi:hypothetical protein
LGLLTFPSTNNRRGRRHESECVDVAREILVEGRGFDLKRRRVKPAKRVASHGMSLCPKLGIAVSQLKRGSLCGAGLSRKRDEIAAQARNIK